MRVLELEGKQELLENEIMKYRDLVTEKLRKLDPKLKVILYYFDFNKIAITINHKSCINGVHILN